MRRSTTLTTNALLVRSGVVALGFAVLTALFALSVVGLVLEPHPIFVVDVAATGYCLVGLAVLVRRSRRAG
ncbi:MAG TPA: hypothetical protein VI854_05995, partial [Acidimicrobiia bacterium]|nr:hypothetical protein [Acidimicrobiia bacterium]